MQPCAQFMADFPWVPRLAAFVTGACIGSFLNVVILRLPAGQSIVRPGSHCACGAPIAWFDNIPILSWLILRGRARCCGRPFSIRYPLVELLTALLFLACWWLFPPAKAAAGMVFLSLMVGATFIDLDHMIIPDVFTIGAALAGLAFSALVPSLHGQQADWFALAGFRSVSAGVVGLLVGSGLVLWIALLSEIALRKETMGFGDVKFVGAIGAFCGWQGAVFAVFGGAVLGTMGFALVLLGRKLWPHASPAVAPAPGAARGPAKLGFGVQVPFGPMLAAAGALYFLFFSPWVAAYFASLAALL